MVKRKLEMDKSLYQNGMSTYTYKQNSSTQQVTQKIQTTQRRIEEGQYHSPFGHEEGAADFSVSQYNTKMIQNVSQLVKSARYQASKLICNPANFHIQVPVFTKNDDVTKPFVIELCQST